MDSQLTYEELAALMKKCAGLTIAPEALRASPETAFADFGLDSLGLLAVVSELEQRYGTPIDAQAESCKTPEDFLALVNETLSIGA